MLLHRLCARFQALLHAVAGRLWFRTGASVRARRHFEQVLRLRGDDFGAYVHLGRLAYAAGDYAGWRRELEHARRTDPERFARLQHPFDLFEPRAAGTPFEEAGERATWRALRPIGGGSASAGNLRRTQVHRTELPTEPPRGPVRGIDQGSDDLEHDRRHRAGDGVDQRGDARGGDRDDEGTGNGQERIDRRPLRRTDDFESAEERRRFARLLPIAREELRRLDLDELCRRLSARR